MHRIAFKDLPLFVGLAVEKTMDSGRIGAVLEEAQQRLALAACTVDDDGRHI
jgi:hypothetical protein